MSQSFSPVAANERLHHIDELRGLAILGILLVNYAAFAFPLERAYIGPQSPETMLDTAAVFLVDFIARNKFYPLFSFLFGVGLAIQYERAKERGRGFAFFGIRRLLALAGIGTAHTLLLWSGDVLLMYAIFGFGLLIVLRARGTTLFFLGLCSLAFFCLLLVVFLLGPALMQLSETDGGRIANDLSEARQSYLLDYQRSEEVLLNGTLAEGAALRFDQWLEVMRTVYVTGWLMAAFFLLGAGVWKMGWLKHHHQIQHRLKQVLRGGLIIGIPANLTFAVCEQRSPPMNYDLTNFIGYVGVISGQLAFLAAMVAFFCLKNIRDPKPGILAPVGRMALSNYLLQSVIFTFIFYGWGLGLLGQIGPFLGLFMTLAVYAGQVWLSHWWLSRFKRGPMEAFWRVAGYGFQLGK